MTELSKTCFFNSVMRLVVQNVAFPKRKMMGVKMQINSHGWNSPANALLKAIKKNQKAFD